MRFVRAGQNKGCAMPEITDYRAPFESELRAMLNRYGKDTETDTPDYILAEYLERCLSAFDIAVTTRDVRRLRNEGPLT